MRYLPKTITTIPSIETVHTLSLGTLDLHLGGTLLGLGVCSASWKSYFWLWVETVGMRGAASSGKRGSCLSIISWDSLIKMSLAAGSPTSCCLVGNEGMERYSSPHMIPITLPIAHPHPLQGSREPRYGRESFLTRWAFHITGLTPLMAAVMSGQYEAAAALIASGARFWAVVKESIWGFPEKLGALVGSPF